MVHVVRGFWIVIVPLALAGCEKADNAPGPGGVSMGEARALDEAAKMLDARQPPRNLSQLAPSDWPSGHASDTVATRVP
jgi:hypothetical protein